ncbi:FAD-dependent oxidoreductase [Granulicella paludicola]|uniref:FAD-dependent oxidoreductase n=1 Tax=Granulicella paludicola TaxID=474951 RepID=UPI0021E0702D|nr:FAD-dependent oxidoreductase [Granulicella paludicola]
MYSSSAARFTPFFPTSVHSLQSVVISGAGLIGLSIALELHHRGVAVSVVDVGGALQQASTAAAGMLAVEDPHNPPEILELSRYSHSLYPEFLSRVEALSGLKVPLQTEVCIQYLPNGERLQLDEQSLDPRQLATALLAAIRAARIEVHEGCSARAKAPFQGRKLIVAAGAWSGAPIQPRKGQMLRVALPHSLRDLRQVTRAEHIYIVPRTQGPQAGSVLIGATVEDAGFDKTVHEADLKHLRARAAEFLPALISEVDAPGLEAWAGLRPAVPDSLPLLGSYDGMLFATGHYRNGILLAPATAAVIADLLEDKRPAIDLSSFRPQRFSS